MPKGEEDPETWFLAWVREKTGSGTATGDSVKKRSTTIRLLVPKWQRHKLSLAGADPRKIKPTCSCILRYAGPLLDVPLDEMTVPKVAAWVDGLQRSGRAPFTVRNIIQAHRSLVIDARGMGWVDLKENPFADPYVRGKLKGIAPKAGKDVIVALPQTDALKLLNYDKGLIPSSRKVLTYFWFGSYDKIANRSTPPTQMREVEPGKCVVMCGSDGNFINFEKRPGDPFDFLPRLIMGVEQDYLAKGKTGLPYRLNGRFSVVVLPHKPSVSIRRKRAFSSLPERLAYLHGAPGEAFFADADFMSFDPSNA